MKKIEISKELLEVLNKISEASDKEEVEAILAQYDPKILKEYKEIMDRDERIRPELAALDEFPANVKSVEKEVASLDYTNSGRKKRNLLNYQPYVRLVHFMNHQYNIDLETADEVELEVDDSENVKVKINRLVPFIEEVLMVLLFEIHHSKLDQEHNQYPKKLEIEYLNEKIQVDSDLKPNDIESLVKYLHTF